MNGNPEGYHLPRVYNRFAVAKTEEIQRTKGRTYVTQTFQKVDEILENDGPLTDSQIVKFTCNNTVGSKEGHIHQLNGKIAETLQTQEDLQTDILETEEIQDTTTHYDV